MIKNKITAEQCNNIRQVFYSAVEDLEICPVAIEPAKLLNSREHPYVLPREIFMHALQHSGYNYVEIGRIMFKDRTTYMKYEENIGVLIDTNPVAKKFYNLFKERIDSYNAECNPTLIHASKIERRKYYKGIHMQHKHSKSIVRSGINGVFR